MIVATWNTNSLNIKRNTKNINVNKQIFIVVLVNTYIKVT